MSSDSSVPESGPSSGESDAENSETENSEFGELSLDDLGAAYARAAAANDPEVFAAPQSDAIPDDEASEHAGPDHSDEENESVSPEGIIEAALFVGHPDNKPFSAARLASLMRDVTETEVVEMIDQLNHSYREVGQAFRIVEEESGYRLSIAPAVEKIRHAFLGKVREARLTHGAIEVLSLVAYQPGITAQKVNDQRGRDCGALLNQLVRRRLLEIKREKPGDGGKKGGRKIAHYYPTERFLFLFGLESLDDLPQVEESVIAD